MLLDHQDEDEADEVAENEEQQDLHCHSPFLQMGADHDQNDAKCLRYEMKEAQRESFG